MRVIFYNFVGDQLVRITGFRVAGQHRVAVVLILSHQDDVAPIRTVWANVVIATARPMEIPAVEAMQRATPPEIPAKNANKALLEQPRPLCYRSCVLVHRFVVLRPAHSARCQS